MNEPQHTPGPWRLDPDFETGDFYFVDDGIDRPNPPGTDENGPDMLAQVYKCVENGSGLANAHLIAAAPQMFAALKEVTRRLRSVCDADGAIGGDREAICAALLALARANGDIDDTPKEGAS